MAMVLNVYSGVFKRMLEARCSDLCEIRLLVSPLSSPEIDLDVVVVVGVLDFVEHFGDRLGRLVGGDKVVVVLVVLVLSNK